MCGVGAEALTETEICVSCGGDTPYDFFDNIKDRMWYVEGSGQLCEKCYKKIYMEY